MQFFHQLSNYIFNTVKFLVTVFKQDHLHDEFLKSAKFLVQLLSLKSPSNPLLSDNPHEI
jgi:hypothetical protein